MARSKRTSQPYVRKSFETRLTGRADLTGEKMVGMCLTQLMSDAWHNLSGNAKNLYLFMRLQYNGSNESCFYFNKALYQKQYKLYSNGTQFKKDLDQLCSNGFVRIVEKGKNTRTKNIYAFSDDWQQIKRIKRDMSRANSAHKKLNNV